MVGNNTPCSSSAIPKFQMFIHTQSDPKTNLRDMDMQWTSGRSLNLHQVTSFSPTAASRVLPPPTATAATPTLVNAKGERVVQVPLQDHAGVKNWMDDGRRRSSPTTASRTSATSSTRSRRATSMEVQRADHTDAQAKAFRWNPFDLTKVWPHKEFPLIEVGVLELNRNPENYHAEVKQSSFSPSARAGHRPARQDAQASCPTPTHRYRVGNNFQQLPSTARCPVMHYQRDGQDGDRRVLWRAELLANTRDGARREPSFRPAGPGRPSPTATTPPSTTTITPSRATYRLLTTARERSRLHRRRSPGATRCRCQLCHFFRADQDYGARVAKALGVDVSAFMNSAQSTGHNGSSSGATNASAASAGTTRAAAHA